MIIGAHSSSESSSIGTSFSGEIELIEVQPLVHTGHRPIKKIDSPPIEEDLGSFSNSMFD
jgi:hypothetical protein